MNDFVRNEWRPRALGAAMVSMLLLGAVMLGSVASRAAAATIPVPPGVDADALSPRTGAALDQAKLSLEAIVKLAPRPDYLPAADAKPAAQAEPHRVVERAYAEARNLLRDGQAREAVDRLEAALRIAPDSVPVLRQLGRIYSDSGNGVKGAFYFQRAIKIDPTDVRTLFSLGLFEFDRGQFGEAISVLAFALDKSKDGTDSDTFLLIRHYLGMALARQGYDAASIAMLRSYLESPQGFDQPRSMRVVFIQRGQDSTWQGVGDAFCRLGEYEHALAAYDEAGEPSDDARMPMTARRVYCDLQLGKADAARKLVLDYLRSGKLDDASLQLVAYANANGVDRAAMAAELRKLYQGDGHSPHLAMAIAQLMDPAEASKLLFDHLKSNPADRVVVERLTDEAIKDGSPKAMADVIVAVADAIVSLPASADRYADLLLTRPKDITSLSAAFDAVPAEQAKKPAVVYLRASWLERQGRDEEAIAAYEKAIDGAAAIDVARASLVRMLVRLKQFDRAEKVLAPLADRDDPQIVALRVRVLAGAGRQNDALTLLDKLAAKDPNNVELIMLKVGLQLELKHPEDAERTLLDALNAMPQNEMLYAQLLALYDIGDLPNAERQRQLLLRRLIQTLPDSRLARFERGKALFSVGQLDGAAASFLELVREDPRDYDALQWLAIALFRLDRADQALKIIDQHLGDRPNDAQLMRVADSVRVSFGQALLARDRAPDVIDMVTRALDGSTGQPDMLFRLLGQALIALGREAQIDDHAKRIMAKFPADEGDIMFSWAMLYESQHDRMRSEQILLDLLKKHPEHVQANNSLGYTWADAGRNLDQAEKMIQIAVKDSPDSAAYIDSLGWVQYKLGKFDDAFKNLSRAVMLEQGDHPVIMNHLGDAMYRTGRKNEALQQWREAAGALGQELQRNPDAAKDDPELSTLGDRLRAKIQAASQGLDAPVAPSKTDPAKPANEAARPGVKPD